MTSKKEHYQPKDVPRGDEHFIAMPVKSLWSDTALPVDVYLRTAPGQYTFYRAKHTPITVEALQRLEKNGITEIHLTEEDSGGFYDYIEDNLRRFAEGVQEADATGSAFIYENTSRLMSHLWNNFHDPAAMRRIGTAVEATVTTLLKDENALWDMLSIAGHDYYTYTHCVNVSAIMVAAAKKILQAEEKVLCRIGLGGMLHDIGKKKVPDAILKKRGKLSDEEFNVIRQHPLWGISIAEEHHGINGLTCSIIRSHHEKYNGGGYPDGDASRNFSEPERLAKIVDIYDALTTNRSYARAVSSFRALSIMKEEMSGEVDGAMLREFILFLGTEENNIKHHQG